MKYKLAQQTRNLLCNQIDEDDILRSLRTYDYEKTLPSKPSDEPTSFEKIKQQMQERKK